MKKYVFFPIGHLLQDQPFVYCNAKETAEAVATRFHKEPDSIKKYKWQTGWAAKDAEHWAVVEVKPWIVIPGWAVREGERYVGTYHCSGPHYRTATEAAKKFSDGEWKPGSFHNALGPVVDRNCIVIVQRDELVTRRRDLTPGDCFVYLDAVESKRVCATDGSNLNSMPGGWKQSTQRGGANRGSMQVWRIPHWCEVAKPEPVQCTPEARKMLDVLIEKVNGVSGAECLVRLENAMRTESLVITRDADTHEIINAVSTLGNYGMNREEFELGSRAWSASLRAQVAKSKAEAEERERNRVVLDYDVD